ncbi:oligosaccharide flippase family protein [Akkermansiaceae bacterium]|nr:oligosaccharide flippase family protein [Akkermansiaceae bacterium]
MKTVFRKNISDGFWYTFGDIINRAAVFLLIPFYTAYFTKEEYGLLSLVVIFTTISNHLISFGSKTALLRLVYDYPINEKKALIFTTICNLSFVLFTILVFLLGFNFIAYKCNWNVLYYLKYCYFICFHSFFFSIINIGLTLMRVDRKAKSFITFISLKVIIEILLIFFFVKFLTDGILGKIVGSFSSVVILSFVIYFFSIRQTICFRYSKKLSKVYLNFATPLVINNLIGWTLVSYDQFLFKDKFGLKELAVLTLVLQICSIYKVSMEGALRAFNVYLYEKMNKAKEGIEEVFLFFISLFSISGFLIIIFKKEIILLISTSEYMEGETFIVYFVFSRFIMLISILVAFFVLLEKNSKEIAKSTVISMLTMLIFSTYLIPNYGFFGASITAILTYASGNIYLSFVLKKSMSFYSTKSFLAILVFVFVLLINICFLVDLQLNLVMLLSYTLFLSVLNKETFKRIFA